MTKKMKGEFHGEGEADQFNDAVRNALMDTHCKVYVHKAKAGLKESVRKKLNCYDYERTPRGVARGSG